MQMDDPGAPQTVQINTECAFEHILSVRGDLSDGGWEAGLEFVSQKVQSKSGPLPLVNYDSAGPPTLDKGMANAATMRKMIGKRLDYQIGANGKVRRNIDLTNFVSRIGRTDEHIMEGWITAQALLQYCDLAHDLPDNPVKTGDHWPIRTIYPIGAYGMIEMQAEYTFKGFEQHDGRDCVRLEYSGKTAATPLKWVSGIFIGFDAGDVSGVEWFDVRHGMLVEKLMTYQIAGRIYTRGREAHCAFQQTVDMRIENLTVSKELMPPANWLRGLALLFVDGVVWLFLR